MIDYLFHWIPEPEDFACPNCSRLLDRPAAGLPASPVPAVALTGREPLRSSGLLTLVRQLRDSGTKHLKLLTHGDDLAEGSAVSDLFGLGLLAYDLELFGPRPSSHDVLSGRPGSFRLLDKAVTRMWDTPPARYDSQKLFFELHVPVLDVRRQSLSDIVRLALFWKAHRILFDLRTLPHPSPEDHAAVLDACLMALSKNRWAAALGLPLCLSRKQFGFAGDLFFPRAKPGCYADDCADCLYRPRCPGLSGASSPHQPVPPSSTDPEWESFSRFERTVHES